MPESTLRNVSEWAVGLTTAPRSIPTLSPCISSLRDAGWAHPRLFVEPGTDVPPEFSELPKSLRDETLGAFPNWYLGVTELFLRQPRAEAFLICQDDILLSRGLRRYLEHRLWPSETVGVVSLYRPSCYPEGDAGTFTDENRGWSSWGALAYVFSNPGVRQLLADPILLNHRHHGPGGGLRNIDSIVGAWCERQQLPYYVHTPSLVQHIGDTSTIYANAANVGSRMAASFQEEIRLGDCATIGNGPFEIKRWHQQ